MFTKILSVVALVVALLIPNVSSANHYYNGYSGCRTVWDYRYDVWTSVCPRDYYRHDRRDHYYEFNRYPYNRYEYWDSRRYDRWYDRNHRRPRIRIEF